tara:strand:- start:2310 stop:2420 length:111 start_codon:yes stop_codon:yes gene_type:complete
MKKLYGMRKEEYEGRNIYLRESIAGLILNKSLVSTS